MSEFYSRHSLKMFVSLIYLVYFLSNSVKGVLVEDTGHFTLTCPKDVETVAVKVSYADGQNETLASFSAPCTVYKPDIVCYNFLNTDKIIIVPISVKTRTIVSYSCNSAYVRNVTFFAKPSNISCTRPTLDVSGVNVLVTCRTSKIFPQAGCIYFDMTNNVSFHDHIVTIKQDSWGSPVYYSAECTLKLPVSSLRQGRLEVQVLVYPVMDDGVIYGINYTVSPDIVLEPIEISLDSSCLQGPNTINGYIKSGTEATCTCMKTSPVDIIGRVNWYENDRIISLNETDPSVTTLTVSYPTDYNTTYHCRATPIPADSNGIEISTSFGFGPNQVFVTSDEVVVKVCPNSLTTARISCWAPRSDVSPDVTIDISTDRPDIVKTSIGPGNSNVSMDRGFIITLSASKGGKYVLNCSLINTVFMEYNALKSITIIAREAPKDPPIFLINGGQPIKEGINSDSVNFTCSAPGGYPSVSNLTIICLGQTIFMEGSYWSIKMALTREFNGSLCTCAANHVSGCYVNNLTKSFINVTYNVNITHFEGNNATELEVQKGDSVKFNCAAESNPKPVFTLKIADTDIRSQISFTTVMNTVETSKNNWQAEYNWNVTRCEDTNTYTCVTHNLYYDVSMERSMRLYVKCPFQVLNESRKGEEIPAKIGEDTVITLDVYGHPHPIGYELFKGIQMSAVDNEKFNATFTEIKSPHGIITLKLRNVQKDDLTLYTLVVNNGIENPLQYRFLMEKASEDTRSDETTPAIIGGVLGGVILLILTGIIVFIIRKKNKCRCVASNSTENDPAINISDQNSEDNVTFNEHFRPNLYQPDVGNTAGSSRVRQKIKHYRVTDLYPTDKRKLTKIVNPSESSGSTKNSTESSGNTIFSVMNSSESSGDTIISTVMNRSESSGDNPNPPVVTEYINDNTTLHSPTKKKNKARNKKK